LKKYSRMSKESDASTQLHAVGAVVGRVGNRGYTHGNTNTPRTAATANSTTSIQRRTGPLTEPQEMCGIVRCRRWANACMGASPSKPSNQGNLPPLSTYIIPFFLAGQERISGGFGRIRPFRAGVDRPEVVGILMYIYADRFAGLLWPCALVSRKLRRVSLASLG